jgi:catecholate siderophore receptor
MSKFRMTPLAVAILAAYSVPLLAQEAEPSPAPVTEGTRLPAVRVEGAVEQPFKANRVASPKFTQPLVDTPQTFQIITDDLFNQQGATTLTEALRNSPAVGTFYAGENGNTTTGDAIYMRGFDTSSSIFVDGVRDLGSISRDLFNVEQVEVQKGPAGTDNGRSAPTGAINLVSKRAFLQNATAGTATVGTDGQKRAAIDFNQPFDGLPGSALRLNAVWQDSEVPGRDHVEGKRVGFAPSLGFGLDGATRTYVNLLYVKQDNVPDGLVPTIGLPGWTPQPGLEPLIGMPVNPDNFYGTRDDHDDVEAKMATVHFERDLSDTMVLSNITRWGETTQDYLLTAFLTTSSLDDAGNPTGNVNWTDPNDPSTYTLARGLSTFKDQRNTILTNQLNLRVDFVTGKIQHTLSTGLELTGEKLETRGISSTGSRPPANLYNPNWNDVGDLAFARNGAGADGKTNTASIYAFDTVKFNERFLVIGGIRADRYKTDYQSTSVCGGTGRGAVDCGALPTGTIVETINTDSEDTLFNWKLGAVYKPAENGSVYLNYAVSQQPPGGDNFQLSTSANSLNNPNLDPQKADTYEVGTKWEVFNNALALNLAVFRTEVSNEINNQITDEAGNPTQTGEKRVQGIELTAVGNITENWSVSAGYSLQDNKVEEGPAVSVDGSSNLTYTPDDAFTSWTAYRFPFGLTLGGGVRYTDGLHRGTDGAVGTPSFTQSYTVFDALASFVVNGHMTVRVNGYNLLDEDYVAAINKSGYRYTPGASRTFLVSGDFSF